MLAYSVFAISLHLFLSFSSFNFASLFPAILGGVRDKDGLWMLVGPSSILVVPGWSRLQPSISMPLRTPPITPFPSHQCRPSPGPGPSCKTQEMNRNSRLNPRTYSHLAIGTQHQDDRNHGDAKEPQHRHPRRLSRCRAVLL